MSTCWCRPARAPGSRSATWRRPWSLSRRSPAQRIVVATATLALQAQLANADIPAALAAVEKVSGERPVTAVLKGRTNYACLLKVRDRVGADQGALISAADLVGAGPRRRPAPSRPWGPRCWRCGSGPSDELEADGLADRDSAPSHTERGWQQVSIPVRECLGVQRCPQGANCFVEKSREQARAADLIVTNHALLAIDAMHGGTALPEHEAVIIDEAHELVARVTGAASAELSPQAIERVARRVLELPRGRARAGVLGVGRPAAQRAGRDGAGAGRGSRQCVDRCLPADRRRHAPGGLGAGRPGGEDRSGTPSGRCRGQGALRHRRTAWWPCRRSDVVWVADRDRFGREARVAPLSVAGLLRERVFADRTVVLTSATLKLGGDFDGVAASLGLRADERCPGQLTPCDKIRVRTTRRTTTRSVARPRRRLAVRLSEAGHPLHGAGAGPARAATGVSEQALAEIAELVWAAGGRTLGLFSSRRAAEAAARVRTQATAQAHRVVPGRCAAPGAHPAVRGRRVGQPVRDPVACGRASTCLARRVRW